MNQRGGHVFLLNFTLCGSLFGIGGTLFGGLFLGGLTGVGTALFVLCDLFLDDGSAFEPSGTSLEFTYTADIGIRVGVIVR